MLALVAFAATLLTVALTVMVVAGNGITGLGDATSRAAVLRGPTYESALARGAGLCAVVGAFTSLRLGSATRRLLMVAGGALISGSFLLTGHAGSRGPAVIVRACLFAHVFAVVPWTGGVPGMSVALRRRRAEP